ncbi:hypothetical protein C4559_06175 [Candidatus Microgenomates bacterium]|nr:MAG: hypothetical protein C4559_06175 [Candidatus Microgenomates bacterium]
MVHVGQKLHDQRIKKGLSLEEVEKAIKIKSSFLSAIEKGEYKKLPSSAYAYGFVKNYAEFLDLPIAEILAVFRREFDGEKVFRVLPKGLPKEDEFPIYKLKLQQIGFIIVFIFFMLLAYILFQYRFAFINPPLEIMKPSNLEAVSVQNVQIYGKTDPNATVYVNNSSVSLDQNGIFKKTIDLFPGKTTILIRAINRFGRETIEKRSVEVK